MESGLLQLGNGAGHAGRQDDALDQMIGQFGGNRLMRPLIQVDTFLHQLRRLFQIALWQAMNTTPRCCRAGMVSPAGPNTLFGSSCAAVSVGSCGIARSEDFYASESIHILTSFS
jgi:hypothetical protein